MRVRKVTDNCVQYFEKYDEATKKDFKKAAQSVCVWTLTSVQQKRIHAQALKYVVTQREVTNVPVMARAMSVPTSLIIRTSAL